MCEIAFDYVVTCVRLLDTFGYLFLQDHLDSTGVVLQTCTCPEMEALRGFRFVLMYECDMAMIWL